ncbi:hypothetical protein [Bacteroides sp.]|uniref:hypothetical protein n=1 Tax=Bacteroides sp. TaxID=29523 RepID=UPI00260A3DC1|nr:hypothetical protein [Bacteroides sp.]MDD3038505.1 hypothetical protein [Bacteroides sp.]
MPGVTCHYINTAFDGLDIFGVIQVKVQKMVATQVIPRIASSQIREISVLCTLDGTG